MKRIVFPLLLSSLLCGCGLVQDQHVPLKPEEVAVLQEKFGEVADDEAIRQEVQRMLGGAHVKRVVDINGRAVAILEPPALEGVEEGGATFVGEAAKNIKDAITNPAVLGSAGLAALAVFLRRLRNRRALARGERPKKK